jgi:2-succinyl-5-enolpyruvyl-6-hydroxy-3-cyclohexene-1-carboxylate synthase
MDGGNIGHNPNMVWAEIFVDELSRCGLQDVCIAPGSRSTPLTLAFYAHPSIRIYSHLDERSAGFFGLGLAIAGDRPVALLCTSGTAGANFFPAIIEAEMSQVPLLVLTADRPPELRHSGANQTIDQVKMFGDHVLWAVDNALPEEDPPDIALRNLRTLAARAMAVANGIRKGPVHLNFPFRKPLEPKSVETWLHSDYIKNGKLRPVRQPFTTIERGEIRPTDEQIKFLSDLISTRQRGIIICGPLCPGGDFPKVIGNLARRCNYPLFADPLSGLRFGPHVPQSPIVGSYENFLNDSIPLLQPELVLYFGAVPTAKNLNRYLAGCDSAVHIHVRENGVWADENHVISHVFQVDPRALCQALYERQAPTRKSNWLDMWLQIEAESWRELTKVMDQLDFDGAYVYDLLELLTDDNDLFAGNSLPVRHVVQFGKPQQKSIHIFANRGASGIDGNISTGLGIAGHGRHQTTILTGDITFYHDSNGLLGLRNLPSVDITFIVLNNDGGGIFHRLPVARFEPPFKQLFQASHELDLSSIAKTYDLDYYKVQDRQDLQALFIETQAQGKPRLIEIKTDPSQDNQSREYLESAIRQNLAQTWASYSSSNSHNT